ncbi:MAG: OmpH family outer membrane protein [Planctomycetota bacterium]
MRNKRWHAALALVLASGAAWAFWPAPEATTAQPAAATASNTAVLNLSSVLQGLAEQRDFQTQAQAKLAELQAEQQRRRDELANLETEVRMAAEGEARNAARTRLLEESIKLDSWTRIQQAQQQQETKLHTINVYRKINQAAGEVAQENGFQVVVATTDIPDLERLNAETLAGVFQSRKVLWHDPAVDVTAAVVQRLNAQWQNP